MEARFGIEHDENRRKHEQRADEMQKWARGDGAEEEFRETQQNRRHRYDPERDLRRSDDRETAQNAGETTEPAEDEILDADKEREKKAQRVNTRARVKREQEFREKKEKRSRDPQDKIQEEHDRKINYMNNQRY